MGESNRRKRHKSFIYKAILHLYKKNEKNSKKVLHKWSFCCIIYER